MELIDVVDGEGNPTGEVVSREQAHAVGTRHRTAHVWIIREEQGRTQILLQKRAQDKDSFPGMYDTSSAGHIPAGDEPRESALRELGEELGIHAEPEDITFAGIFRISYKMRFHGKPFQDQEVTFVYVLERPIEVGSLTLQASEVDEVRWFDLEAVVDEIAHDRSRICVPTQGLQVLCDYLNRRQTEGASA